MAIRFFDMFAGIGGFRSGLEAVGGFECIGHCEIDKYANQAQYLYPQNLKATANLWLWSLKDFCILGIAALLSIVILVQTRFVVPVAVTLCYGFLTIRMDDTTVLDFMKYAVRYFISTQQEYKWR